MKILLIHTGRVGSRAITRALSKICKYPSEEEPFQLKEKSQRSRKPSLSYLERLNSPYIVDNVISHASVDFHIKSIPLFDKTILITRRETKEQAISYAHAWKYLQDTNSWHKPYADKISELTQEEIQAQLSILKNANRNLNTIANESELPIFYYEDLFSEDSKGLKYLFKYLDIEYKDYYRSDQIYKLNPRFRYRTFVKNQSLF